MVFYQICFGQYCKNKYAEAENLIQGYLATILRNGQINRNYSIMSWNGEVVAYINAYGYDANCLKSHCHFGKEKLRQLKAFFGQPPVWRHNEDFPVKRKTNWKDAPFLYLATDLFDSCSPLTRGDDGMIIPLYRVPISDMDREAVVSWQWKYQAFDEVWIDSCELEMKAYRVIAEPESKLSKKGRELCLAIEKATGVPTYYYLKRYYGRDDTDEKRRRCPLCGKPWHVKRHEKQTVEDTSFGDFAFQCVKCRLVSHIAPIINLRNAKIGEPKKGFSKQEL